MADNYAEKTTGVNKTFSQEVEEENRKRQEEYEQYLKDAMAGKKVSPPGTVNKKEGGSMCGKPTGQGYRKARMR